MWHLPLIAQDPTIATDIPAVITATTITMIGVDMVPMVAVAPISRVHTVEDVAVDYQGSQV